MRFGLGNSITKWGLLVMLLVFLLISCRQEVTLEDMQSKELARGVRYDSLIYGVHFGMSMEDFANHCAQMNRKKLFMPNTQGNAVRIRFTEGYQEPVQFEFFPDQNPTRTLVRLTGALRYESFSYYDKKYAIKNLLKEAIGFFEDGYGGNEFIALPHENVLLEHKFVKIDGNRKIILSPTFDGQVLEVVFEDISKTVGESKK